MGCIVNQKERMGDSFPQEDVDNLKKGDIVKITLHNESFWCLVYKIDDWEDEGEGVTIKDAVYATVNNNLRINTHLKYGSGMVFHKEAISEVYKGNTFVDDDPERLGGDNNIVIINPNE